MNRKAQLTVGGVVMIIMAVIAGLALLTAIFNQQAVMTTKQQIANESIDITGIVSPSTTGDINLTYSFNVSTPNTGWKINDCPLSGIAIINSSGSVWTDDTDYVFDETYGNFTFKNTLLVNETIGSDNITYVTYTFCTDGYNKDGSSRSIAGLIGLFAALGLLGYIISYGIKEWL